MLRQVVESVVARCGVGASAIIMGDANVRNAELKALCKLGVVEPAGKSGNTWDSRINLFHQGGFGFACAFDRVFLHGARVHAAYPDAAAAAAAASGGGGGGVGSGADENAALVGATPVGGVAGYYLSDHFGLVLTVRAAANDANGVGIGDGDGGSGGGSKW
jgi:hypothetical protein